MPTKEESKVIPVQSMTLPDVMGLITRRMLTVLVTDNVVGKQTELGNSRVDLRDWYESQRPSDGSEDVLKENRRDFAKKVRKVFEHYRNVTEELNMAIGQLTAGDLQ
jgi:hypothetical protein